MVLRIKICGLSTEAAVAAAVDAGADMIGFVFHPKSPRYVTPERSAELAKLARGKADIVSLTVDADDTLLRHIVKTLNPDWLQFHGKEGANTRADLPPVLKAVGIAVTADVDAVQVYKGKVPLILLDAKPPKDAAYPGGHGAAFDWTLLKPLSSDATGYMLSGGLHPQNVAAAIATVRGLGVHLAGVDVSSGVESAPGVKDTALIRSFIAAARAADVASAA
jgi:phosphoribosylanthranilate isomerase